MSGCGPRWVALVGRMRTAATGRVREGRIDLQYPVQKPDGLASVACAPRGSMGPLQPDLRPAGVRNRSTCAGVSAPQSLAHLAQSRVGDVGNFGRSGPLDEWSVCPPQCTAPFHGLWKRPAPAWAGRSQHRSGAVGKGGIPPMQSVASPAGSGSRPACKCVLRPECR